MELKSLRASLLLLAWLTTASGFAEPKEPPPNAIQKGAEVAQNGVDLYHRIFNSSKNYLKHALETGVWWLKVKKGDLGSEVQELTNGKERSAAELLNKHAKSTGAAVLDGLRAKAVLGAMARFNNSVLAKKPIDANEVIGLGLSMGGIAAFAAKSAAYSVGWAYPPLVAFGGAYAVYNIPFIKLGLEQNVFGFGEYLIGPLPTIPLSEFDNNKVNRPYLVCNYYEKDADLAKGLKPKAWDWVRTDKLWEAEQKENAHLLEGGHADTVWEKSVFDYNGYMVLNGRWLRVISPENTIFRFATIHNILQIVHACKLTLKHKKLWKDSEPTPAELARIVPTVAYSSITAGYPIYPYEPALYKDGETMTEVAVLMENEMSRLKPHFDEADTAAAFLGNTLSVTSFVNAWVGSDAHKAGKLKESMAQYDEIAKDIPGAVPFDADDYAKFSAKNRGKLMEGFNAVSSVMDAYSNYNDVRNAYKKGQVLTVGEFANMAKNSVFDIQGVLGAAKTLLENKNIPTGNIPYFNEFALGLAVMNFVGYSIGISSPLDVILQRSSLAQNPQGMYEPAEFATDKLVETYVACQFYENLAGFFRKEQLFWSWMGSDTASPEADPSVYDKYYRLKGRWVVAGDGASSFFTLEDPAKLRIACIRDALRHPEEIPEEFRARLASGELDLANFVPTAGNTRFTYGYQIGYGVRGKILMDETETEIIGTYRGDAKKSKELQAVLEQASK